MVPLYTGYSVYAELKIGSNGTNEGVAEIAAGDATGASGFGHTTWDDDVSDGVDSDWVRVQLVAGPSGVTWTVGDQPPVHVANSVAGDVLALKIRAAVNGGGRQSSWRDLVASFYESADADPARPSEQLTLARSRNPVASTMGAEPGAMADQAVDIMPDGSGYEKLVLTASVRMQSLDAGVPSPEAVFGQVFLYTSPPPVEAPQSTTTATYVAVAEPEPALFEPSLVSITNFTEELESTELTLLA